MALKRFTFRVILVVLNDNFDVEIVHRLFTENGFHA